MPHVFVRDAVPPGIAGDLETRLHDGLPCHEGATRRGPPAIPTHRKGPCDSPHGPACRSPTASLPDQNLPVRPREPLPAWWRPTPHETPTLRARLPLPAAGSCAEPSPLPPTTASDHTRPHTTRRIRHNLAIHFVDGFVMWLSSRSMATSPEVTSAAEPPPAQGNFQRPCNETKRNCKRGVCLGVSTGTVIAVA